MPAKVPRTHHAGVRVELTLAVSIAVHAEPGRVVLGWHPGNVQQTLSPAVARAMAADLARAAADAERAAHAQESHDARYEHDEADQRPEGELRDLARRRRRGRGGDAQALRSAPR